MQKTMLLTLALLLVPAVTLAQELTGKQITALISGKSGSWQSADGKVKGKTSWAADGGATVTGNFDGFDSDSGKWRVKGNQYCTKWKKIRKGKETCSDVIALGNGTYQVGNSLFKVN